MQSNTDLLAEIFGSSSEPSAPSPAPAVPAPKSTVNDILGLFDSPAPVAPAPAAQPPQVAVPSAFSLLGDTQSQTPPPQPQTQPAAPRLTAYPAYDKNELRISLTPQTSALRPGVVNILARFQMTGDMPASGLNFQAAVPKVCPSMHRFEIGSLQISPSVPTAADAAHVKSRRQPWGYRDTADACHCPSRCKFSTLYHATLISLFTGKYTAAATDIVQSGRSTDTRPSRLCRVSAWVDRKRVLNGYLLLLLLSYTVYYCVPVEPDHIPFVTKPRPDMHNPASRVLGACEGRCVTVRTF